MTKTGTFLCGMIAGAVGLLATAFIADIDEEKTSDKQNPANEIKNNQEKEENSSKK